MASCGECGQKRGHMNGCSQAGGKNFAKGNAGWAKVKEKHAKQDEEGPAVVRKWLAKYGGPSNVYKTRVPPGTGGVPRDVKIREVNYRDKDGNLEKGYIYE